MNDDKLNLISAVINLIITITAFRKANKGKAPNRNTSVKGNGKGAIRRGMELPRPPPHHSSSGQYDQMDCLTYMGVDYSDLSMACRHRRENLDSRPDHYLSGGRDYCQRTHTGSEEKMSIKALRKEKGLTQQALADASGIFIRQLQKIEAGEIDIGRITLKNGIALAKALGVEPEALLKETT